MPRAASARSRWRRCWRRKAAAHIGCRRESAGAEKAAAAGQGEERHLHVHGGRTQPARSVRSQARAGQMERQAAAGRDDEEHEARLHQADRGGAGQPARVQAGRPIGHRVFRLHSAHGLVRRRYVPGPLHVQRCLQSSSGPVAAVQRHHAVRASDVRRLGALRAGQRIAEPAGLRGAELGRRHQRRAPTTGPADFCPPPTRA